ncbi:hypothetical protein DM02DRAFT_663806 [Periconia macrospinosa]|uniref:Uncharacterized protein n=1 Tax=Periconia macrospinosa TaxID=97972 RepID=A0A2V1D285_9PLEO|nr:hypothetical protein DM02DRAFT_663806 [Periconia macrospinosa]
MAVQLLEQESTIRIYLYKKSNKPSTSCKSSKAPVLFSSPLQHNKPSDSSSDSSSSSGSDSGSGSEADSHKSTGQPKIPLAKKPGVNKGHKFLKTSETNSDDSNNDSDSDPNSQELNQKPQNGKNGGAKSQGGITVKVFQFPKGTDPETIQFTVQ